MLYFLIKLAEFERVVSLLCLSLLTYDTTRMLVLACVFSFFFIASLLRTLCWFGSFNQKTCLLIIKMMMIMIKIVDTSLHVPNFSCSENSYHPRDVRETPSDYEKEFPVTGNVGTLWLCVKTKLPLVNSHQLKANQNFLQILCHCFERKSIHSHLCQIS